MEGHHDEIMIYPTSHDDGRLTTINVQISGLEPIPSSIEENTIIFSCNRLFIKLFFGLKLQVR